MPPALDVARRFAEAIATLRALHDFDDWIGQFWIEGCSAQRRAASSARPAGGDDSIVWHETGNTIFGYLPGRDGCFAIPRDMPLPDFSFTAGKSSIPYGEDIVISAAMGEELQTSGR
ncbi:MAG: hypothetical protein M3Q50_11595 [Chloroflexota bacterium]|nr:hypothetical protein [Chloroflexia bacterium]MDQ3227261.1 hypothetical protein [Chloroflexota bacterium]